MSGANSHAGLSFGTRRSFPPPHNPTNKPSPSLPQHASPYPLHPQYQHQQHQPHPQHTQHQQHQQHPQHPQHQPSQYPHHLFTPSPSIPNVASLQNATRPPPPQAAPSLPRAGQRPPPPRQMQQQTPPMSYLQQSLNPQPMGQQSMAPQSLSQQSLSQQSLSQQPLSQQPMPQQSMAPQSMPQQSLASQSMTPQSLTPQSLTPQSMTPQSLNQQPMNPQQLSQPSLGQQSLGQPSLGQPSLGQQPLASLSQQLQQQQQQHQQQQHQQQHQQQQHQQQHQQQQQQQPQQQQQQQQPPQSMSQPPMAPSMTQSMSQQSLPQQPISQAIHPTQHSEPSILSQQPSSHASHAPSQPTLPPAQPQRPQVQQVQKLPQVQQQPPPPAPVQPVQQQPPPPRRAEPVDPRQPSLEAHPDDDMDAGSHDEDVDGDSSMEPRVVDNPAFVPRQPMGAMMTPPPEGGSFPTLDAVHKYVLSYCTSVGYAVVIGRSKKTVPGLKKVLFVCDRAGKPPSRVSPEMRKRKTTSRKCDCPFGFFAIEQRTQWTVRYRPHESHQKHNHGPSESPLLHPAARKLDSKMVAAVKKLKDDGVGVSQTLEILQNENPHVPLLPRDIYNARAAINRNPQKVATGLAEDRPAIYSKPHPSADERIRADLRRELATAREDMEKMKKDNEKEISELKAKIREKDKIIEKFEQFIDICNQRVMVSLSSKEDSRGSGPPAP